VRLPATPEDMIDKVRVSCWMFVMKISYVIFFFLSHRIGSIVVYARPRGKASRNTDSLIHTDAPLQLSRSQTRGRSQSAGRYSKPTPGLNEDLLRFDNRTTMDDRRGCAGIVYTYRTYCWSSRLPHALSIMASTGGRAICLIDISMLQRGTKFAGSIRQKFAYLRHSGDGHHLEQFMYTTHMSDAVRHRHLEYTQRRSCPRRDQHPNSYPYYLPVIYYLSHASSHDQ
jgi:hypothetical protein